MTVDRHPHAGKVDIDFTLALNNATGKYFFGRDMIASAPDLVRKVYYWRLAEAQKPEGLKRRILGRLARWEVEARALGGLPGLLFRPDRPLVFTDPREVAYTDLRAHDVVLCHDLGPISHPDFYDPGVSEIYRRAHEKIRAAKPFMLFVSESTRDAFIDYFGRDYACLRVTYINPRAELDGESHPVPDLPERYLLTVGAIGRRKNQESALKAYAQSGLHEQGVGYVICGGPEPGAEPVMELARRTAGVRLTGYADDAQLRWLYHNAEGLVLPSRLEGFGVPAMEAILYRAMPLVTRGGALNEVTGDDAILVGEDAASIADGMLTLVAMSPAEKAARLDRMTEHIKRFSFAHSAAIWRRTLADAATAFDGA